MNIPGLNNQLIICLKKSFSTSLTYEIKQIEKYLADMSVQQQFLDDLIQIIKQTQLQQNIRIAAATYLKTYTNTILNIKNQSKTNIMTDKMLKCLASNLPIKFRRIISYALQNIIKKDSQRIIRVAYTKNLINQLSSILTQTQLNQRYIYLVFFGKFMLALTYPLTDDLLYELVNATFQNYIQLNIRVLIYFESIKNSGNTFFIQQSLQFLKQFSSLFKIFFKINYDDKKGVKNKLFYSTKMDELIKKILRLNPTNNQQNNQFLVLNSTNAANNYNSTKSNFIGILQFILKFRFERYESKLKSVNPIILNSQLDELIATFNVWAEFFLQNIYNILMRVKYYQMTNSEGLKAIEKILRFFTTFIQISQLQTFYAKNKKLFLYQIILPLFQFPKSQKQIFQDSPEEFINNLNTIIDKNLQKDELDQQTTNQNSKSRPQSVTFHMVVSQMLTKMMVYSHGSLFELINLILKLLQSNNIQKKEQQIFLMVLCILCYNTKSRVDIQLMVKQYLQNEMNKLNFNTQVVDQKFHICLILMNISRYQVLFHQIDQNFSINTLSIVFKILKSQNINQSMQIVTIQLVFTLLILQSTVIKDNCLQIYKIFQPFFAKPTISPKMFDVIYQLYRQNNQIFHGNITVLLGLIKNLIQRIQKQINEGKNNKKIIINKCWNNIKQILHISQRLQDYEMEINLQNSVSSLYKYLNNLTQNDFEQDILQINIDLIRRRKHINQKQLYLFQFFPKIFNKDFMKFNNLFQIINLYILYGKNFLVNSNPAILALVDISLKAIFVSYQNRKATEADPVQGALILQNLIINVGQKFQPQVWKSITTIVTNRIINGQFIKFSFLRANLYLILLLILVKNALQVNQYQILFSKIIQNDCYYQDDYTVKLYTICMSDLLKKYTHPVIFNKYGKILKSVIQILRANYQRKQKLFNGEDDDELQLDEQEYFDKIGILQNDVKKLDQHEYLRQTLMYLKNQNADFYNQLMKQLSNQNKLVLKTIFNVHNFADGPRKIVKIKYLGF